MTKSQKTQSARDFVSGALRETLGQKVSDKKIKEVAEKVLKAVSLDPPKEAR